MTDDISKVVREMRSRAVNLPDIIGDAMRDWADRLESATTPAAINPASVDNQFTYSPIEPPYRLTPAITTDGHAGVALDPEGSYTYYNDYTTLARLLAEAKADAERHERNDILQMQRAIKAESQLAEATRRLGEVEGLLREALRGWDDVIEDLELNGLHDDPHFNYRRQKEWIGAVEAKAGAALTKEPTK